MTPPSASVGRDGIESIQGSVSIPSTEVAYTAYSGFTTKWTLEGGCGWKIKPRHGRPQPADQASLEVTATGGPLEFASHPAAEGGASHESGGPELENEISHEEVSGEVKQSILGGVFELGANGSYSNHGVGGGIHASCDPGTIRLMNGVSLRVPAVNLKIADYNAETKELSICRLETKIPITAAEFNIHRPNFDIKVSPHLELKFKLEPNWFSIAERLGIELAADAGVGEAAMAVAAEVGVDLLGFIAAPAVGAALLGVAAHEFREGDELIDAANSTASNVYVYCEAYARSWMTGRATHGPGGRAAQRDIDAARRNHPGLQVEVEAQRVGEQALYGRVFDIVGPRAIEALKARIRRARFLRGSEELTIEDRVHQARWGGNIWRAHGAVPPPRAARDRDEGDAGRGEGDAGRGEGGAGRGEGGGAGRGEQADGQTASAGVTANQFDPQLAELSAKGAELARIHSREQALLAGLNRFSHASTVYERHGDDAGAALTALVEHYRDRFIPKVLALRELYRRLHVSEQHWKVHPHYADRRQYDPNLRWAKQLAEATMGVPHPNDPRIAQIDGFIRRLQS